jgi:hypothetical protein
MNRALFVLFLSFGCSALAHADVYKCTDHYGIVYQSMPCAPGQSQTLLVSAKPAPPPAAQAVPAPPSSPRAPSPASVRAPYGREVVFRRTTIALGMSDDEVLNLPGWGVPNRIERSREPRLYRESWSYRLANGDTRWLRFTNARLTGIDVEPALDRYADLAPR